MSETASWKSKALAVSEPHGTNTNVLLRDGIDVYPLPPNSTVIFKTVDDEEIVVKHSYPESACVRVSGGTAIAVYPESSNVVSVRVRR